MRRPVVHPAGGRVANSVEAIVTRRVDPEPSIAPSVFLNPAKTDRYGWLTLMLAGAGWRLTKSLARRYPLLGAIAGAALAGYGLVRWLTGVSQSAAPREGD